MKNDSKKRAENRADLSWGLAVRRRDVFCRLCIQRPTKDAHHIIKRGNKRTRHLISNGIGLCYLCHKYVEALYTKDWSSPWGDVGDYDHCMIGIIGDKLWDGLHDLLKDRKFKYTEEYIEEQHNLIKAYLEKGA